MPASEQDRHLGCGSSIDQRLSEAVAEPKWCCRDCRKANKRLALQPLQQRLERRSVVPSKVANSQRQMLDADPRSLAVDELSHWR